jgi:hypothetical protein
VFSRQQGEQGCGPSRSNLALGSNHNPQGSNLESAPASTITLLCSRVTARLSYSLSLPL